MTFPILLCARLEIKIAQPKIMELLKGCDVGDVHLLPDSWKLWYWNYDGPASFATGCSIARQNWLDNLHGLCEFDSVEKFWRQVHKDVLYDLCDKYLVVGGSVVLCDRRPNWFSPSILSDIRNVRRNLSTKNYFYKFHFL